MKKQSDSSSNLSRRDFINRTAAVTGTAVVAGTAIASSASPGVLAGGSDKIRVAMIGCGNRGTRDASYN